MEIVYSVGNGNITRYKIVKETPKNFRIINSGGNEELLSKYGQRLPCRLGGKTSLTKCPKEAAKQCQIQINEISKHVEKQRLSVHKCAADLRVFVADGNGEKE